MILEARDLSKVIRGIQIYNVFCHLFPFRKRIKQTIRAALSVKVLTVCGRENGVWNEKNINERKSHCHSPQKGWKTEQFDLVAAMPLGSNDYLNTM